MTGGLITALQLASIALNASSIAACWRREPLRPWVLMTFGNGVGLVAMAASRTWWMVALHAAFGLIAAWMWWRNRKGKGRARAALSGKYRHVRDAMVRTLRERRVARPALAPGRAG